MLKLIGGLIFIYINSHLMPLLANLCFWCCLWWIYYGVWFSTFRYNSFISWWSIYG